MRRIITSLLILVVLFWLGSELVEKKKPVGNNISDSQTANAVNHLPVSGESDATDELPTHSPDRESGLEFASLERQTRKLFNSPRPDGVLQWDQIEIAIRRMLEIDTEQALLFLGGLEETRINHYLLRGYIFEHFEESGNWSEALRMIPLVQDNTTLATPLLGELIDAHAKDSLDSAFSWLLQHSEMHGCENAAYQLGRQMGASGRVESYLGALNENSIALDIRKNLFRGLAIEWVRNDFTTSVEHFSKVSVGPEFDGAIYEIVGEIAKIDGESTISWAELIHDHGLRRSAMIEAARNWKKQDEATYAQWKTHSNLPADLYQELP